MRILSGHELSESARDDLAHRLVAEFGQAYPDWSVAEARSEVANPTGLPQTWCLVAEDGSAIASASLLADDEVTGYEHITPWLGNVLVAEAHRGRGLGAAIVDAALDQAWDRGFHTVHLVTDTAAAWYERRGWVVVGVVDVHGTAMQCMRHTRRA